MSLSSTLIFVSKCSGWCSDSCTRASHCMQQGLQRQTGYQNASYLAFIVMAILVSFRTFTGSKMNRHPAHVVLGGGLRVCCSCMAI